MIFEVFVFNKSWLYDYRRAVYSLFIVNTLALISDRLCFRSWIIDYEKFFGLFEPIYSDFWCYCMSLYYWIFLKVYSGALRSPIFSNFWSIFFSGYFLCEIEWLFPYFDKRSSLIVIFSTRFLLFFIWTIFNVKYTIQYFYYLHNFILLSKW